MNFWTQALFLVAVVLSFIWIAKGSNSEREILNEILDKRNFDKRIRPNGKDPVVVTVNLYIRSFKDWSETTMTYKTQLTFRQIWVDERLKYNASGLDYVTVTEFDRMWYPDIFFSNEITGHSHSLLTPNKLVRIFPDGKVLYSTRISLELSSPMDLTNYPFDNQISTIVLASYAYTTKEVVFMWKEVEPVQITKNLHVTNLVMEKFFTDYCTSKTNTGEYSCLKVDILFSRVLSTYFIRYFMPTMGFVFLSCIIFWLNPQYTVIRLGIWMALFWAMISVVEDAPRLSRMTALDVWMGICVSFLFCILVELCLVYNAMADENSKEQKDELPLNEALLEENAKDMNGTKNISRPKNFTKLPLRWLNRYSTKAQRIDAISRILFPVVFALFNLVYWTTYNNTD